MLAKLNGFLRFIVLMAINGFLEGDARKYSSFCKEEVMVFCMLLTSGSSKFFF